MDEITCDICRDLFPLVNDGVASADSESAVKRHIESCTECKALFDGIKPESVPETHKAFLRVKRWLTGVYAALMVLGIWFGLTLTASEDLFFNCLIMPIAGAFGYFVFRWRAVFAVPAILFVESFAANALGQLAEKLDIGSLLGWAVIYSLFALSGVITALLLRFAFGKEGSQNER